MQQALAVHPLQCFSFTPKFHRKHHCFQSLRRNKQYPLSHLTSFSLSRELKVSATTKQKPQHTNGGDEDGLLQENVAAAADGVELGWLPAFPHVLTASMSNFLFGYHIGVMNGPIISIAKELGFEGNSFLEGLVVSIFIGGAFIGSIACGSLVDKLGCRRTFQIDTVPLILGAIVSAQAQSIEEMLLGRFLVGLGIGVNTVLVPIYISEVAPTKYRGSLGSLCQIGTCVGIIASLCLAIPAENDPHCKRKKPVAKAIWKPYFAKMEPKHHDSPTKKEVPHTS